MKHNLTHVPAASPQTLREKLCPPVPEALTRLEKLVSEINDSLCGLEDRLASVLEASEAPPKNEALEPAPPSNIAERINQTCNRLVNVEEGIRNLRTRLQI